MHKPFHQHLAGPRTAIATICALLFASILLRTQAQAQTSPATPGATPTPPPQYTFTAMKPRIILIPANTIVPVNLDTPISSQTAKVGDTVSVTVDQNIVADNALVVAKGAKGQGHVQSVTPAVYHLFTKKPGSISIAMDWITAIDGEKVELTGAVTSTGDLAAQASGQILNATGQEVAMSTAGGRAALGASLAIPYVGGAVFPALSMVQIGRGTAATIGPRDVLVIQVQYAVHVTSGISATQYFAPGFAH